VEFTLNNHCRLQPPDWINMNSMHAYRYAVVIRNISVPCKVLGSVIRDAVVTHLEQHNFYTDCQHGFMKRRSTLTNLLVTLKCWTSILEEGSGLDVIYLDYNKAFDTVPHQKLLQKLMGPG